MKTKLFLLALIASLSLFSCEEDEFTEIDSGSGSSDTYLVTQYKYKNTTIGTINKTFTYNSDNLVSKITEVFENETTTYDISYDNMNRVIKIDQNGEGQYEFEYSAGKIVEKWNYNMTDYWQTINYDVDSDGKILRRQEKDSDSYSIYIWENGNMISNTFYYSGGNTTTTYTYDTDILNPGYDQYLLEHPMWESKNAKSGFDTNSGGGSYTLSSNSGGYLTSSQAYNSYLGTTTETYTYTTL